MADPIQHVVVLVLENQSFDRLVGLTPGVDGVTPLALRSNPDTLHHTQVVQNPAATATDYKPAHMDHDPKHDYQDVRQQIGSGCAGFVDNFLHNYPKGNPREIMAYYDAGYLPTLNTLARQFVICDRWFCSVPGPTWANRFFINTGTSLGHLDMPSLGHFDPAVHNYNQPTIFERLSEASPKVDWRIYFHDFSQTALLTQQRHYAANYRYIHSFYDDCKNAATFPQYAFLEPKYFWPEENDQHPTSDIRRADGLIARVYNALRANAELWNTTLFVILYDEHGGFYDHVDPSGPAYKAKAVPPDAHISPAPDNFAFDLFGPRVAAVLVSPLLDSGVLHGIYDHTSLLKYLTQKWTLGPLGNRTAAANNFADELVWRTTPRPAPPTDVRHRRYPRRSQAHGVDRRPGGPGCFQSLSGVADGPANARRSAKGEFLKGCRGAPVEHGGGCDPTRRCRRRAAPAVPEYSGCGLAASGCSAQSVTGGAAPCLNDRQRLVCRKRVAECDRIAPNAIEPYNQGFV